MIYIVYIYDFNWGKSGAMHCYSMHSTKKDAEKAIARLSLQYHGHTVFCKQLNDELKKSSSNAWHTKGIVVNYKLNELVAKIY